MNNIKKEEEIKNKGRTEEGFLIVRDDLSFSTGTNAPIKNKKNKTKENKK